MSRNLRLMNRTHGTIRHGRCALCGRPYEGVAGGWVLHDGASSWGEVCLWCVEAGPGGVTLLLRRRADRIRRLAERCRPCLGAWGWTGLHRLLHEHATALERLAEDLARHRFW